VYPVYLEARILDAKAYTTVAPFYTVVDEDRRLPLTRFPLPVRI